jgi:hypothetical protein
MPTFRFRSRFPTLEPAEATASARPRGHPASRALRPARVDHSSEARPARAGGSSLPAVRCSSRFPAAEEALPVAAVARPCRESRAFPIRRLRLRRPSLRRPRRVRQRPQRRLLRRRRAAVTAIAPSTAAYARRTAASASSANFWDSAVRWGRRRAKDAAETAPARPTQARSRHSRALHALARL